MRLDLSMLEKIRRRGSNTIARCPACAEFGGDRKGEHLFINNSGHFGCVLHPGVNGKAHRQRIFELVGINEIPGKSFEVRKPLSASPGPGVIQKDILGHLGHLNSTHARISLNSLIDNNIYKDSEKSVPSVPGSIKECQGEVVFTPEEEHLLAGIDVESLEKVRLIKAIFEGTVISVEDSVC